MNLNNPCKQEAWILVCAHTSDFQRFAMITQFSGPQQHGISNLSYNRYGGLTTAQLQPSANSTMTKNSTVAACLTTETRTGAFMV